MPAYLQELGKLTTRGKALWFASLLLSIVLLVFGVFLLVTQDKNTTAISVEFNADTESARTDIFPGDDFSTYFPTNTPSNEEISYKADKHHPTSSPIMETTRQPVASPTSSHPSMQGELPSVGQSQIQYTKITQIPSEESSRTQYKTITPTTLSPTTSPTTTEISHPTRLPTPSFLPTTSPESTNTTMPTQTPQFPTHDEPYQSVPTFFNYNTSESSRYGPHSWSNVTVLNSTENYWYQFGFVANECSRGAQSPIDVCTQPVRYCEEYHEFRAKVNDIIVTMFTLAFVIFCSSYDIFLYPTVANPKRGDFKISSEVVEKQIMSNKLRAIMMRRVGDEPDPPQVDFSGVGYADLDLLNIDIKIPAEHTICDHRYSGEMQYYFFHPVKQSLIAISWLFDAKPDNVVNRHIQLLIDEFQKVYDGNEQSCKSNMETTNQDQSNTASGNASSTSALGTTRKRVAREPIWDPFHSDIQKSIHFWGYRGSLTEPPCSPDSVLWRIMDVPVPISQTQLYQMQNILFNNREKDSCVFTSTHYKGSVARPISKSISYYKCTRSDYVSDAERALCGDLGCELPYGKGLDHYFEPIVYVTGPPSESPTSLPSIIPTAVLDDGPR